MKQSTRNTLARKFNVLDFHDDNLVLVRVSLPQKQNQPAKIDFEFRDDSTCRKKVLTLNGSANLRWIMDFDVMANNSFAQTEKAISISDIGRMERFVHAQMPQWHITYMPPSPKDKPIRKKLSSIRKYVLFRVTFLGGTVEVLAKDFTLRRMNKV